MGCSHSRAVRLHWDSLVLAHAETYEQDYCTRAPGSVVLIGVFNNVLYNYVMLKARVPAHERQHLSAAILRYRPKHVESTGGRLIFSHYVGIGIDRWPTYVTEWRAEGAILPR